jgi:hypothetical protein
LNLILFFIRHINVCLPSFLGFNGRSTKCTTHPSPPTKNNTSTILPWNSLRKRLSSTYSWTNEDKVEGILFYPCTLDDTKKLNNFEGEQYVQTNIQIVCQGKEVTATTYVWSGQKEQVSFEDWDFNEFRIHRLLNWLDLFDGFEFT